MAAMLLVQSAGGLLSTGWLRWVWPLSWECMQTCLLERTLLFTCIASGQALGSTATIAALYVVLTILMPLSGWIIIALLWAKLTLATVQN